MKDVIAKKVQSLTNQITAIEHHEMKKLNTSTSNEIVNERYRHVFRKYDATQTISLELSLRVATHLATFFCNICFMFQ